VRRQSRRGRRRRRDRGRRLSSRGAPHAEGNHRRGASRADSLHLTMSVESLLEDSTLAPEAFVRRALGELEAAFRAIALRALADWALTGIVSTELFQPLASL